ncbi:MAG: T9SS type A sorting domain-containing protein [Flavobacteriales bacterium]|nr:T9SS type A sorting domain-containing protein [Flavobacteriales bacterium]
MITQQDLDNGGRAAISFLDPLVLGPGAYYVSANLHQEVGQDISISDDVTVPQPPGASLIYLPIDAQNRFVYSNGNAWAVRLAQFYRPNAIGELPGLEGISLSPNPTAGLLHIRTEASGNMTVEVFNALGAKVRTANFTGNSTSLDLTGNAAGIYSVVSATARTTRCSHRPAVGRKAQGPLKPCFRMETGLSLQRDPRKQRNYFEDHSLILASFNWTYASLPAFLEASMLFSAVAMASFFMPLAACANAKVCSE